jgi:Rrf2 family protein
MRISASADYAVRAAVELAAAPDDWHRVEDIAALQDIPARFLENILVALRNAGIAQSRRGPHGGYRLARPAGAITLADVIRASDGPLAAVQGVRPESVEPRGNAAPLRDVWIAVRANLRAVLESVTLADVASGKIPANVKDLTTGPGAWDPH